MPKLEILFGPVASGKSTYSRRRASDGALIANDDAIVLAVHGGEYSLYAKELKPVYKALRGLVAQFGAALGRDVIIAPRASPESAGTASGPWGAHWIWPWRSRFSVAGCSRGRRTESAGLRRTRAGCP